jgi:hypothetical protein
MRRYVVVGSQTLSSSRLLRELRARQADGPCRFHVVVPAANPHVHAFWTEGEARAVAQERLEAALEQFRGEGIDATGSVGDANPADAVADVLLHAGSPDDGFDGVIVCTLPPGLSRWIHQDVPRRIERRVALPVRHVVTPFDDLRPSTHELESATH